MREIKFRAWDKHEKKMILDIQECQRMYSDYGLCLIDYLEGEKFYEVMQYTGLKDKNGKEIYDGDLLKWYGRISPVKYEGSSFGYNPFGGPDKVLISYCKEPDIEIVGNIYENPELIDKKIT